MCPTLSRAGPSSPRITAASPKQSAVTSDSEDGFDLGLDDLLPEPESPLPVPYSYATYAPLGGIDLQLPDRRKELVLRLVGAHPLWGHHLWNTSRVMSDYLLLHPQFVTDRTILELGAGAGLPGIVSGLAGAKQVVITDYPDEQLLENIRFNVECNAPASSIQVAGHVWGHNIKSLPVVSDGKGYDLLLLSDLVFNHSQHSALVATVNATLRHCEDTRELSSYAPSVLVFFTHHRPHLAEADMSFFPLLVGSGSGWAYEKVVEEWAGAMFQEDPGDRTVRGTVHGFRCWRVRDGEQPGERPSQKVSLRSNCFSKRSR